MISNSELQANAAAIRSTDARETTTYLTRSHRKPERTTLSEI